ncbi:hypothetical protein JCM8547_000844 [Rhodosporidiobolus lusitaniae]
MLKAVVPQDAPSTTTYRSTPRWRRANVVLGKVIPSLLLLFAVKGYRLVLLEVFPHVISRNRFAGVSYFAWVHLTLAASAWSYFQVYFEPLDPPKEKDPPLAVQERRVVFACEKDGSPARCWKDRCGGACRSIRTRHCRDCGTCRAGQHHHCSFADNCVTTSRTFKPFTCFLFYAAALLVVALVPLAPLQLRACREVIKQTWSSSLLQQRWWSRWYGWAGGPVWHYAGALYLGYKHYQTIAPDRPLLVADVETRTIKQGGVTYAYDVPLYPSLAVPHLGTLVIVLFAVMISLIAFAMIAVIVRDTRTDTTPIQVERTRLWRQQQGQPNPDYDARFRLWVPLPKEESTEGGAIVIVDPDVPLFDLGPEENWRRLMGEKWWHWFLPWIPSRVSDFDFNPAVLASLEEQARKAQ